ncbi:MAG TPA: polyribonucleotide nucleotidyltransferase [Candidatus Taylorbacteria bacterium]|nr:MAG: Polyribonucleotide nucleotidyltransferase [Parcubacteria group bacterium GW2011_GWA2_47_64]KKU96594.1 MAG: Polyribonucleotide nucleotidyltransferase [Parcubacteria group bacterium GW2011_GWC2_48_17]HBV01270.1 polyribonucleotide nucleotidyltransferase [Candidatus Taylorbacteria bacterium]
MKKKEYSIELGGKTLTAEFTDLAEQANGSVIMKYGNTTALITATMSKGEKETDFFPLTVDYEERFYAAGEILGSRFIRREGRPTDEAVLSGRIVDRTIRPLFDQRTRRDVQVVITILSIDEDDPDILAVLGASLALGTSDIPWNGPVSAVRIGKLRDTNHLIINPIYKDRAENPEFEMDLVACGKDGLVNMIEVGGKEVQESVIVVGLEEASKEIEKLQTWQKQIVAEIGKKKQTIALPETPAILKQLFAEKIEPRMKEYVFGQAGNARIYELKGEWMAIAKERFQGEKPGLADNLFEEEVNNLIHSEAIENNKRPDGRGMDDLRPLFAKAGGISKILHGSGVFYRGQTHILSVLTLGGPGDAQIIDNMEIQESKKRFIHHYNFPPFSTGETGRIGSTNRRMIGHGALAEKALIPVIPQMEKFPYTIRLVSEAFASNGSTSMGSVCGSTLALMDGGVPITSPVAGIASGLMMRGAKEYKVLTDIQGPEDHHGDMDFKVAGTRAGVTAVQMDVKVDGVPIQILAEAFEKAKLARYKILDVIAKEIPAPRPDISPLAPKIITMKVKKDQIGLVIGGGGKTINGIKEKTGVDAIDIEEDGTIFISGKEGSADKAAKIIEALTHEYKRGERTEGEVVKIAEFGAFVAIGGGNAEGLVHVSEIAPFRIDRVESVLHVGDNVPVVVKDIDERGRIKLSIKDADPNFIKRKA